MRTKAEERSSVAEAATAAHLEPVGARARDRGRDPTLDPTRQRRERGDLTEDERRRRESQRPPHDESLDADGPTSATVDAFERALQGGGEPGLVPPSSDLTARAFELIQEWGRERIQSGDLPNALLAPRPIEKGPSPATDTRSLANLRRAALRAYKRG